MRRKMSFTLAVVITCILVLAVQDSMLAQVKSKQKSQGKMQKTKEMNPRTKKQSQPKIISVSSRIRPALNRGSK